MDTALTIALNKRGRFLPISRATGTHNTRYRMQFTPLREESETQHSVSAFAPIMSAVPPGRT